MTWTLHPIVAAIALTMAALPAHASDVAETGPRIATEEVRIPSEPGVVLAGALHKPRSPGPHPVVLFLAGSGANPRGAFDLLIDGLVDQGIAVFDYDKRGTGGSGGVFVDDFALIERDAAAAVAYLRSRADIDRKRIAIGGVSQGAAASLAVAGRDPAISALVMLAGPVGKPEGLFLAQMRTKLHSAGMREEAIAGLLAATKRFMDVRTGDAKQDGVAALREELAGAFMAGGLTRVQAEGAIGALEAPSGLSIYKLNPYQTLTRLRAPVLALYASRDTVIGTNELPVAKEALARNPDATVIEIAGINHWFQRSETGEAQAGRPLSEPKAIDLIETWLTARLRTADKKTADLRR